MEKNKKKFVVAAIVPVFLLVGILLYIAPFSPEAGSGTALEQKWANNSNEAMMHGKGRGASSHGDSAAAIPGGPGSAYASPHESWNNNSNESFERGKGRGRFSSNGSSDMTAQKGRGRNYGSSHNNSGSGSLQTENQGVPSQQGGGGFGRGQSVPQNYPVPVS